MPIKEIMDNKMPSLTEWMEQIGLDNVENFRQEDNNKRDRLEILFQITGLPYDRPEKMTATDIVNKTPIFLDILKNKGDQQCALRLVPYDPSLPKLRVRGKTLKENLLWFNEQKINPKDYKVEIVPHSDACKFSSSFLINDHGIVGEITKGLHWQLSQGLHDHTPTYFNFDFTKWNFSTNDAEMQKYTKQAVEYLLINKEKQNLIQQKIDCHFNQSGYLNGYFEYSVWPDNQIFFFDYNRVILEMLKNVKPTLFTHTAELTGTCASPGIAQGKAKIVLDPKNTDFADGEILICPMTMIDYMPLMKKAGGIITEQGNILSHAAIVSRELKKPCIVGVKNIITKIKNGQNITLDANKGTIILN